MLNKYLANARFDFADLRKRLQNVSGYQVKTSFSFLQLQRLLIYFH
jgi:hypothetical protein